MTLGWLLVVAAIVTWHWAGLILVPVVLAASVLLVRATRLGSVRTDHDSVLPSVGRRVTPAPRLPLGPRQGVDA